MRSKTWTEALRDGFITGAIVGAATTAAVAVAGRRDSGSSIAPINATSHIVHGSKAATVTDVDVAHTALGFLLNMGAAVMWSTLYEKAFGAEADREALVAAGAEPRGVPDQAAHPMAATEEPIEHASPGRSGRSGDRSRASRSH